MQGDKTFTPKMFVNFCLADHIPKDNFYSVLKRILDLRFITIFGQACITNLYFTCFKTKNHKTIQHFPKKLYLPYINPWI